MTTAAQAPSLPLPHSSTLLNPESRTQNPPLPPSGRDFIVYQRIVVDHASTWTVAEEIHISQTRVRQIVKKVINWLSHALPADSGLDEAASLRLGQHIAADRLQRYLVEADRLWKETTQAKYVNLCLRIITAQSKIPAFPGELEALAADAIDGPLPEERGSGVFGGDQRSMMENLCPPKTPDPSPPDPDDVQAPTSKVQSQENAATTLDLGPGTLDACPPIRDCSPKPCELTEKVADAPPSSAGHSSATETSVHLPPKAAAARKALFALLSRLMKPAMNPPLPNSKSRPVSSASCPRND